MTTRADHLIETVLALEPLSELPRTGWRLRGVRPCESIAEHCFGATLVTMLLVDAVRAEGAEGAEVDGERALRMALLHDAPEARTGDLPMPSKTPALSESLYLLESTIADQLLSSAHAALWREAEAAESLEARIVRAADKIQMMLKVLAYERSHRGWLVEFWDNPKNFDDRGVAAASEVFEAICARAGRTRPLPGGTPAGSGA